MTPLRGPAVLVTCQKAHNCLEESGNKNCDEGEFLLVFLSFLSKLKLKFTHCSVLSLGMFLSLCFFSCLPS